jgi:hypothetical protein
MGWWKDRIDRAFIARFRQPDAMPASAARSAEPSGG